VKDYGVRGIEIAGWGIDGLGVMLRYLTLGSVTSRCSSLQPLEMNQSQGRRTAS
jgi:hypothetical protein